MSYSVRIDQTDYVFGVDAMETVLQAALRQNIPLAWGCGGGVCGVCMGQVLEGKLHYPDGEPLALFEEDAIAGKALFCVAQPQSNLVIALPELTSDWEPLTFD